jgi:DnaJ-class molecular chaperone
MFQFKIDTRNFKKSVDACPDCKGLGQTGETSTVFADGKTKALGSGCPTCKGLGKLITNGGFR